LFTSGAIETIFEHAQGIPRTISVICDKRARIGICR